MCTTHTCILHVYYTPEEILAAFLRECFTSFMVSRWGHKMCCWARLHVKHGSVGFNVDTSCQSCEVHPTTFAWLWYIIAYGCSLVMLNYTHNLQDHFTCTGTIIAPVPVKQPWRIWVNKSHESIMNRQHNCNITKHSQIEFIFYGI